MHAECDTSWHFVILCGGWLDMDFGEERERGTLSFDATRLCVVLIRERCSLLKLTIRQLTRFECRHMNGPDSNHKKEKREGGRGGCGDECHLL